CQSGTRRTSERIHNMSRPFDYLREQVRSPEIETAVLAERERIKSIIRKHEESAIDLVADEMTGEATSEKERTVLYGAAMFLIQTLEAVEEQIDQHNKSRITIGERRGVRP